MIKLPISVFIITYNEADRIHRAIESVRDWVDEIIVVDSQSTDTTCKVAEQLGARVIVNKWPGYGPQKRFAESQCRNDWLLNIDADEELTPQLAQEIQALFAQGSPHMAGYYFRLLDVLPGERHLSRFAHINTCLRLYNKHKGRFSKSTVHDSVIIHQGETGNLQHVAIHRSFRSLMHAVEKINSYSTAQAADMLQHGKHVSLLRLIIEFPVAFFKCYFLRLYVFRGIPGFSLAIIYAFGRFLRLAKTRETQNISYQIIN